MGKIGKGSVGVHTSLCIFKYRLFKYCAAYLNIGYNQYLFYYHCYEVHSHCVSCGPLQIKGRCCEVEVGACHQREVMVYCVHVNNVPSCALCPSSHSLFTVLWWQSALHRCNLTSLSHLSLSAPCLWLCLPWKIKDDGWISCEATDGQYELELMNESVFHK